MALQNSILVTYRPAINTAIQRLLDDMPRFVPAASLSLQGQWGLKTIKAYTLGGGKRLRGILAASVYDTVAQNNTVPSAQGLCLAAVLELIQSYLLIVDDVMDKSPLRRNSPSVQRQYAQVFGGTAPDEHEANMMAINIGLLTQHIANIVLLDMPNQDPTSICYVLQSLHANSLVTGLGQIDDLYQQFGRDVDEAQLFRKYEYKSSYYTFINPLQCGLALAGSISPQVHEAVCAFGLPAGVAFQLWDDYLGIFGVSKDTGKGNLDDIREGKYTMLIHQALSHATAAEKSQLKLIIGNPSATAADLATIQDILVRTQAVSYVTSYAKQYATAAKQAARASTIWGSVYAEELCALVDYAVERSS